MNTKRGLEILYAGVFTFLVTLSVECIHEEGTEGNQAATNRLYYEREKSITVSTRRSLPFVDLLFAS